MVQLNKLLLSYLNGEYLGTYFKEKWQVSSCYFKEKLFESSEGIILKGGWVSHLLN